MSSTKTITDFDGYQNRAARFEAKEVPPEHKRAYLALGLAEETGEVVQLAKKVYNGKLHTRDQMAKELGDTLWYVARLAALYGLALSDVAQGNLDKLEARHPHAARTGSISEFERADSISSVD